MRLCGAVVILLAGLGAALAQDAPVQYVDPPDRDVTPPGFTPAPAGEGPLVRVPVPPPPPDPPRWRRYFLPETLDAATFRAGDLTIAVSGVTPPAVDAVCDLSDGTTWPCGRSALFSLRRFLHGRAVECYLPRADGPADVIAPCRVGLTDIGAWLLSQGWATPNELSGDDYRALAETAQCAGRGLWRASTPPEGCPAPPPAVEQTLPAG